MTPEQQRLAIAEACGWVYITRRLQHGRRSNLWGQNSSRTSPLKDEVLPDYLNDLNAMHEAEKVLGSDQQEQYLLLLGRCVSRGLDDLEHDWNVVHAIAAQRAEAFLKTIGKWQDSSTSNPTTP